MTLTATAHPDPWFFDPARLHATPPVPAPRALLPWTSLSSYQDQMQDELRAAAAAVLARPALVCADLSVTVADLHAATPDLICAPGLCTALERLGLTLVPTHTRLHLKNVLNADRLSLPIISHALAVLPEAAEGALRGYVGDCAEILSVLMRPLLGQDGPAGECPAGQDHPGDWIRHALALVRRAELNTPHPEPLTLRSVTTDELLRHAWTYTDAQWDVFATQEQWMLSQDQNLQLSTQVCLSAQRASVALTCALVRDARSQAHRATITTLRGLETFGFSPGECRALFSALLMRRDLH